MSLYSALVYNNKQLVSKNYNLEKFNFFFRSSIETAIEKIAVNIIDNLDENIPYKIIDEYEGHKLVIYCFKYIYTYIVICSLDYPTRTAYTLINSIKSSNANKEIIKSLFLTYQDPVDADKIAKIKVELEETKIVLINSIEKLLERGDKLDNLVDRTEKLKADAETFVIKTDRSCCTIF